MIFPKAKPDGAIALVGGFIKGIKSFITGQAEETINTVEVFPISDERNNCTCLHIYLHDELNLICTGNIQRDSLKLYRRIIDIYKCMHSPFIANVVSKKHSIVKKLPCKELQNVRN